MDSELKFLKRLSSHSRIFSVAELPTLFYTWNPKMVRSPGGQIVPCAVEGFEVAKSLRRALESSYGSRIYSYTGKLPSYTSIEWLGDSHSGILHTRGKLVVREVEL